MTMEQPLGVHCTIQTLRGHVNPEASQCVAQLGDSKSAWSSVCEEFQLEGHGSAREQDKSEDW